MFAVEDDRRTSVSDPTPQTSTIDEVTLGDSFPNNQVLNQRAPQFPQHVGASAATPIVENKDRARPALITSLPAPREVSEKSHKAIDKQSETISRQNSIENSSRLRAIDIWLAARPRIAALRTQILTFRVDVKRERQAYSRVEGLIENVIHQFMEILGTAGTTGAYMSSWDHLEHLRDKILATRDDLKKQREKLAAVEDNLSNQEYKLTEMEHDIYKELDREYLAGPSSRPQAEPALNTPPTTTSDTNTTHSAQQELYSRMGDLRILLDRLNDFEVDIRQELDDRDVSRAHGENNLIPDEQFFEEHKHIRKQLQQDVDRVQGEVSRLKQLCDDQGISYEDVPFPEPLYEMSASDVSTESARPAELPVPEPAVSQRSGSSSVIKTWVNNRDKVKKWLGDPLNPAEVRRPIAEENEVDSLSSPSGVVRIPSTNTKRPSSSTIREIRCALENMPNPSVSFGLGSLEGGRLRRWASDNALQ